MAVFPVQLPNRSVGETSSANPGKRDAPTSTRPMASTARPAACNMSPLRPPFNSRPITLIGTPNLTNGVAKRAARVSWRPPTQNPISREGASSSKNRSIGTSSSDHDPRKLSRLTHQTKTVQSRNNDSLNDKQIP